MPRIRFGNRAGTAWSLGSQSGRVGGGGRRTTEGQGDPGDMVAVGCREAGHRHRRVTAGGFQDPHPVGADLDQPPFRAVAAGVVPP